MRRQGSVQCIDSVVFSNGFFKLMIRLLRSLITLLTGCKYKKYVLYRHAFCRFCGLCCVKNLLNSKTMHKDASKCTIFMYKSQKIFWDVYISFPKPSLKGGYKSSLQNPLYPLSALRPLYRSFKSQNVVSVSTGTGSAFPEIWLPPPCSVGWLHACPSVSRIIQTTYG